MPLDLTGVRELLPDWLPRQRWYAGRGRRVATYEVEPLATVVDGEPALYDAIVAVGYEQGESEDYQLLLAVRPDRPDRLEHAFIGPVSGGWLFDGVHDSELTGELLRRLDRGGDLDRLSFSRIADEPLETDLTSLVMPVEQSNTSLTYGDAYILKLFRRPAAGVNPELEVTRVLTDLGSPHVVPPLAWMESRRSGTPVTLGLLQPYLRSATDGWAMATTSVRDLYAEADLHADEVGGDFAGEALRLGRATARVHADLARGLPTSSAGPTELAALAGRMRQRLAAALPVVPELEAYADPLRAAFDEVARHEGTMALQRIHGDYHLGQVLRTDDGWVLLDFEGEPAKPLAERRAPASPLRDVAGMLRSFDYAARHLLTERPREGHLAYRALEWSARNRAAFCAGYVEAGGADPADVPALLHAFELDKAVYEVVYEARHRPTWLPIPLSSIERLVA
jgi:maltokinase